MMHSFALFYYNKILLIIFEYHKLLLVLKQLLLVVNCFNSKVKLNLLYYSQMM